jgi:hypothetical protein
VDRDRRHRIRASSKLPQRRIVESPLLHVSTRSQYLKPDTMANGYECAVVMEAHVLTDPAGHPSLDFSSPRSSAPQHGSSHPRVRTRRTFALSTYRSMMPDAARCSGRVVATIPVHRLPPTLRAQTPHQPFDYETRSRKYHSAFELESAMSLGCFSF